MTATFYSEMSNSSKNKCLNSLEALERNYSYLSRSCQRPVSSASQMEGRTLLSQVGGVAGRYRREFYHFKSVTQLSNPPNAPEKHFTQPGLLHPLHIIHHSVKPTPRRHMCPVMAFLLSVHSKNDWSENENKRKNLLWTKTKEDKKERKKAL